LSMDDPLQKLVQVVDLKSALVVPLKVRGQTIGMMYFSNYSGRLQLSREEIGSIARFAEQIAGTIYGANLLQQAETERSRAEVAKKETEVLAELSRKANEATDLEAVSQALFDYLREALQLDDFCLFVLDKSTNELQAAAWDAAAALDPDTEHWLSTSRYRLEPDIGTLYRTYTKRKTLYMPAFPERFSAPGDRLIVEKLNLKSALQVPLMIQDEVIGFFTCGPRRRLRKAEIQSIERFCNQVAGAIRATALLNSTAQARERAEAAKQETELLADLSKQANETSSLQNLCETLFDHLEEQYGIENQALFVVDNESYELTPAAARGGVSPEERQRWLNTFRINLKNDPGTMASTYKRQKTFYIKQIPKRLAGKDLEIVETLKPRTILQVPLVLQDRTVGIMVADPAKELTKSDITFIERMCDQIAGAVRTTALLQTTQEAREEAVAAKEEAEVARAESDALLENVLPSVTAKELKESGRVEPVYFDNVSVLFTDFVGFTKAAARLSPAELIQELDGCFSQFDEVSRRNNMEKLKTIGDAYMCAGGLPVPYEGHAIDACLTALEFRSFMNQMAEVKSQLGFEFWQIRIGIHSGPVTAGVIGKNKFSYDIWGDTVNVASRMESSGSPGMVNVSGATYELVKDLFECEYRGKVQAKGKGELDMYFVHRIKPELSADEEGLLPNAMFEMARTNLDMEELEALKAEAHNPGNRNAVRFVSENGGSSANMSADTIEGGEASQIISDPAPGAQNGAAGDRRESDRRSRGERRKPAGARPLSEIDQDRQGW
ncbi:MAG: GAF domain-containing protein, partial [Leptospiraceae bacterium]|nr:GAF domain-containing protein [Leptospiraceae bacterium]